MEETRLPKVKHPTCPYCKDVVTPAVAKESCDACMSWQHEECWSEHGGCAACDWRPAKAVAIITRTQEPEDFDWRRPLLICRHSNCEEFRLENPIFWVTGRCRTHTASWVLAAFAGLGYLGYKTLDLDWLFRESWRADGSQKFAMMALIVYSLVVAIALYRLGFSPVVKDPSRQEGVKFVDFGKEKTSS